MNEIHYRFWTPENRQALIEAGPSLPKMVDIALEVITRIPGDLEFVAGAISTGGCRAIQGNLDVFKRTIEHLYEEEHANVFSQMPFETGMIEFHRQWHIVHPPNDYCWPILHDFYAKIFATGRFKKFHFMHGYLTSTGARWEHEQAVLYGAKKRYLAKALSTMIMDRVAA